MPLLCLLFVLLFLNHSHLFEGGPLYLGDIEDAVNEGGSPCIVCPWHKWCYDLSTGHMTTPKGRRTEQLRLHRVKRGDNGELRVGFESLDQSFFAYNDF